MPEKPKNGQNSRVTNISSKKLFQDLTKRQRLAVKQGRDVSENPIDKGYGVKTPTKAPTNANCRLAYGPKGKRKSIDLYITGFETGFEMAGEIVQSRDTQQFFPSNFVQPAITLTGIAPSDYEYNRIGQYVRQTHLNAVNRSIGDGLTYLTLSNRINGFPIKGSYPYKGRRTPGKEITKGRFTSWKVKGLVQSMGAGAKPSEGGQGGHDFAPVYQFVFMVFETGVHGLWDDSVVSGSTLEDWMANFEGLTANQKKKTFVQRPTPAQKPKKKKSNIPDWIKDGWFGTPDTNDTDDDALDWGYDALGPLDFG